MRPLIALLAALGLTLLAYWGATSSLRALFGAIVAYGAAALFLGGMIYRVVLWAKSDVPFAISTTCGQQCSLPWIKPSRLDNPSTVWGAIGRVTLEVLFFRSLLRNKNAALIKGPKLAYFTSLGLWATGLVFHWSLLVIALRHLRFFFEPVPGWIAVLQRLDSALFSWGLGLRISSVGLFGAATLLLLRRVASPLGRYMSLVSDYFLLWLILGIAGTGLLLAGGAWVDTVQIKAFALGLTQFRPLTNDRSHALFYIHLSLVAVLFVYFPLSKLVHMGGVFLSPTRNLPSNSRARRHVNPWNRPVDIRSYREYEDEFRDKMKAAHIPVEEK